MILLCTEYAMMRILLPFLLVPFLSQAMELPGNLEENNYYIDTSMVSPRTLLIIINEDNYEPLDDDATMRTLLPHLVHQSSPLLISGVLLKRFMDDFLGKEIVSKSFQNSQRNRLIFKAADWTIKQVTSNLYLLIPHIYLDSLNITPADIQNITSDETLTSCEQKLGLKVNHFATFSFSNIRDVLSKESALPGSAEQELILAFFDEDQNDSRLFCLKSFESTKPISWNLIFNGHGYLTSSIVGLQPKAFKNLLSIIETHIPISLLVSISCYAGGLNEKIIYEKEKTFNFPIITTALTDAPVGIRSKNYWDDNKKIYHISYNESDLHSLIEQLSTSGRIDLALAISSLNQLLPGGPQTPEWNNWAIMPRIRLAFSNKFIPMAPKTDIAILEKKALGSIKGEVLDVGSFFNGEPKGILFYPENLLVDLTVSYPGLKAVIPMNDGCKIHIVQKITAPSYDIDDILDWFMRVDNWQQRKIIRIDNIEAKAKQACDVVIVNNLKNHVYHAYFTTDDNKYYHYQRTRIGTIINTNYEEISDEYNITDYHNLKLESTFELIEYHDQITANNEWLDGSFIIKNSSYIRSITTEENQTQTCLDLLKDLLRKKMQPGIVLFIDELTAKSDDSLGIDNKEDRITINDISIRSLDNNKIYQINFFFNKKLLQIQTPNFPKEYFHM